MSKSLKYMPVFRMRQQENYALHSFDFGERIYPCVEIINELGETRDVKEDPNKTAKPKKKFEDIYIPFIKKIKAEKVFVDLPVHLATRGNMKPKTLRFLRTVVADRKARTDYMKRLTSLKSKIIPVISSYHSLTGKPGSIGLQEKDLRPDFTTLAFRTFPENFARDIPQIEPHLTKRDFLIIDWNDSKLDEEDSEQKEMIEKLQTLNCTVIIHRSCISPELTYVGLAHGKVVPNIDNTLLDKYQTFSGSCFSDYSGIKKDNILKGGGISPGFIYYDAVENAYYGFKGQLKKPITFETIIVPDVIKSAATQRMKTHKLSYLAADNMGWYIINEIGRGKIKGRYAAIYKRIAVEHYLSCMKKRISNGDFD